VCGDGYLISPEEECDCGPSSNCYGTPGCNSHCQVVFGYHCNASTVPVCKPICGDGHVIYPETCDNVTGCDPKTCQASRYYQCNTTSNICAPVCGDGSVTHPETCDHGGNWSLIVAGCDAVTCQPASGYMCFLNNTCRPVCGDGIVIPPEICDNNKTGCNMTHQLCQPSLGYKCVNNTCTTICGDGLIIAPELCDHGGNMTKVLQGCDAVTCQPSFGYTCNGSSGYFTNCHAKCGDGNVFPPEQCDSVTGCNANCTVANGYACNSKNNTCAPICGDGLVIYPEQCDHGDSRIRMLTGCNWNCTITTGYACGPNNICSPICGDGLVFPPEQCDNVVGCTLCRASKGYKCEDNVCTTVCFIISFRFVRIYFHIYLGFFLYSCYLFVFVSLIVSYFSFDCFPLFIYFVLILRSVAMA
jgi:cysteine-rich repeat protein